MTAVHLRAERRIAELRVDAPKAKGTRGEGRPPLGGTRAVPPKSDTPTLAEQGITRRRVAEARPRAADKRRAVRVLLDDAEWSAKSDRWIAKAWTVPHE